LLFHLYLLVQHYLFSQQLFLFKNTLDDAAVTEEIRTHVRKNLGNLPFLHWMLGSHSSTIYFVLSLIISVCLVFWWQATWLWLLMTILLLHWRAVGGENPAMQFVLTLITLVCLIIWPLATLLWLQMTILPYHNPELIWWQRATIILDVLLIAWLWPKTLDSKDSSKTWWWNGIEGGWYYLVFLGHSLLWYVAQLWNTLLSKCATFMPSLHPTLLAWHWHVTPFSSLWHTVTDQAALPKAINTLALVLGLLATLFLSLAVATLPDSPEEQFVIDHVNSDWLQAVDVKEQQEGYDYFISVTRSAFIPTAWLHEQHLIYNSAEYDKVLTKGAKPCPSTSFLTNCLMVQPLLPRNLILREKVLTDDVNLKPELEAKLQVVVSDETTTKSSAQLTAEATKAQQTLVESLPQIRGLTLQKRNFDYADFSASSLPKVDLRLASLKHALLTDARLEQAHLNSAHLEQATLSNIKLTGANLNNAKLTDVNLNNAKLTDANLTNANLTGANLTYATLTGADMSSATLTGATLDYANLTGTNLDNVNLTGANLYDANLTDASLSSAILIGATLNRANLIGANLSSANLTGATLDYANLTGANLYNANLTGATLNYGTNLTGADLHSAELTGADMSSANLTGANVDNANLTGADLSETDLTGAILLINANTWSENKLTISADYQQALTSLAKYQNNPQSLEKEVEAFKERIDRATNFSNAVMKTCVRANNDKDLLPDCIAVNALNETSRKELAALWLNLACADETEKQWLARNMVDRVTRQPRYSPFRWFAQPLLLKAKQNCAGLAWLSKDDKASLQAVVDQEAKKPSQ